MGDRGVVQMISDAYLSTDEDFVRDELRLMRSIVEQTRRPLSMTVQQPEHVPDRWREMAGWVDAAVADDLPLRMQVAPRPIGVLQGLQATVNPLALCPSYRDIADLDLEARVIALRDPERRRRLIAEHAATGAGLDGFVSTLFTAFERSSRWAIPSTTSPVRKTASTLAPRAEESTRSKRSSTCSSRTRAADSST